MDLESLYQALPKTNQKFLSRTVVPEKAKQMAEHCESAAAATVQGSHEILQAVLV